MVALNLSPFFVTLTLVRLEATLDAWTVAQTFSHSRHPLHFSGLKINPNFFLAEAILASLLYHRAQPRHWARRIQGDLPALQGKR
jgi:hypothetical protein